MIGIDDAIAAGLAIINKFVPDMAARDAAEVAYRMAMLQAANQSDTAQAEIDKTEAASTTLFIAGWRPLAGWCCSIAVGYQYLLVPLVMWAAASLGHPLPAPPDLSDSLWQLTTAMLGMGALRTFEKTR